jgi:GntR family transcriptional regulator
VIEFQLDPGSGLPTYVQLIQQVRQAVRLGVLSAGDQLPTAREVVAKLAINPNTVLKAYRELEHAGLVQGRPGIGTFVSASVELPRISGQRKLTRGLARWVEAARAAGLDAEDIEALFRAAMRDGFSEGVA